MKKVKAPKLPTQEDLVLRPNRLRMWVIYIFLFAMAIAFGLLLRFIVYRTGLDSIWARENLAVTLVALIGGAGLLSLMERSRWTMRITGGERVEGSSGAMGDRISIPLREIDWQRTQRSLSSRFQLGNAIYGSGGRRILISPWFFNPDQFKEFLAALGGPVGSHR